VRDLALYEETKTSTRVPLHLGPAESVFIVFRKGAAGSHWTRLEPASAPSAGIEPVLLPHSATPGGPMWLSDGKGDVAGQFINLRKSFDLPQAVFAGRTCLELDLGAIQNVARVILNGKPLGVLWKSPYCVDITRAARPGSNEVVVEVANTWNNRLTGDAAPGAKRVASTNLKNMFSPDPAHLKPSGLIGPVRILFANEVPVAP